MARLSRMRISGIRNFSCDSEEEIKFESPVTLFLGQNGSGKTTILEAIKFALTGDLPGGTKGGQGFIYDPQMAKKCETRGQVKLKVYDTKGEPFTVTKIASSKVARDKLKYSFLSGALTQGGETITTRCAEINREVASYIGIPLPIVNYVLFCHQEDSYWPLEEPKKLKERFDVIFDSNKYNKLIEHILKLKKQKQIDLKLLAVKVDYARDDKNLMEKKRDQLREKEERLQALNDAITEIETNRDPVRVEFNEVLNLEKDINTLSTEVELLRNQVFNLEKQEREILTNCTEIKCSDVELDEKISKFESDLEQTKQKISNLETEVQGIEREGNECQKEINRYQNQLGQLQAEKKENDKKIVGRDRKIEEFAAGFNVLTTGDNEDIIKKFGGCIKSVEVELSDFEKSAERREKDLQDKIDVCRMKITQLRHEFESKEKAVKEYKSEINELSMKLSELDMYDNELKLIEGRLKRIEKEIHEEESLLDVDKVKKDIEKEMDKNKTLDDQLQKIEGELQILQRYSTIQTEIDMQDESLVKHQNDMQKLKLKHEGNFKKVFGDKVPELNLKPALDAYLKNQNKSLNETSGKITGMQRDVIKLETNLKVEREKLKIMENDLRNYKEVLEEVFKFESYENIKSELAKKIEDKQNIRSTLHSSKYLYTKFISRFKSTKPCCPICQRDVTEQNVTKKIVNDLEKHIVTIPEQFKKAEQEVIDLQKEYNNIIGLKPKYDQVKQLETDIPTQTEKIKTLEKNLQGKTAELHENEKRLAIQQSHLVIANNLSGDTALIDQNQKEIKRIQSELTSLHSKLPRNISNRSKQEVEREQEDFKSMIRTTRKNIETFRTKLSQHTEKLQVLKDQRNDLKTKELNFKKDLQGKDQLFVKQEEIESKIVILETEIVETKSEIKPMEGKLQELTRNKETSKAEDKRKREEMTSRLNRFKNTFSDITSLQRSIREFIEKGIDEKISQMDALISEYQQNLRNCSDKKAELTKKITDHRDQLINRKSYHRELQDNVRLREKRREIEQLSKKLKTSENKLGEYNITTVARKKLELSKKLSEYDQKESRIKGQKEEQESFIKELKKELAIPKYANAVTNYKSLFLDYKILQKTIEDLGDFAKAVDWGMLQYHKQQMVSINQNIRDLWQSVYRGNDIDYIAIQTEMDTRSRADNRRTYNYRLVQVKNSVEIEMRGRCSAGQKVLASLIIRIALADTFSTKCGILALDEPTTNLDKDNVTSLCSALCDLINRKRAQKNFQLLIITHDQEFLSTLCREIAIDSYNLVKRNTKGQSTVVNKPNDL